MLFPSAAVHVNFLYDRKLVATCCRFVFLHALWDINAGAEKKFKWKRNRIKNSAKRERCFQYRGWNQIKIRVVTYDHLFVFQVAWLCESPTNIFFFFFSFSCGAWCGKLGRPPRNIEREHEWREMRCCCRAIVFVVAASRLAENEAVYDDNVGTKAGS